MSHPNPDSSQSSLMSLYLALSYKGSEQFKNHNTHWHGTLHCFTLLPGNSPMALTAVSTIPHPLPLNPLSKEFPTCYCSLRTVTSTTSSVTINWLWPATVYFFGGCSHN